MSISAVVDECGCTVVATSQQYLELELALHRCIPDDDAMGYDSCRSCAVGVPHSVCANRRTA